MKIRGRKLFHQKRWMKSPLRSLGSNQVDLGGISRPASATDSSSSMDVGYMANATPPVSSEALQRLQPAYAADEADAGIFLRIFDPEYGIQDMILKDGHVQITDRVPGVQGRARLHPVPASGPAQAEFAFCRRTARCVFRSADLKSVLYHSRKLFKCTAVPVCHNPVVVIDAQSSSPEDSGSSALLFNPTFTAEAAR